MSDLLKEIIDSIGVEFLSGSYKEITEQDCSGINFNEQKIYPDFDHVTQI